MRHYQIDTTIELTVTFLDAVSGVPVDPSIVTLYLQPPGGAVEEFTSPGGTPGSSPVVYVAVGQYSYTFTPMSSGVWTYKFQGTGAVVATTRDEQFTVDASVLIPG